MVGAALNVIRRSQVERATGPSPWDLTNEILYELCRTHPTHTDREAILAKLHIIGRVYAASIERRRNKTPEETTDSFLFKAARVIQRSSLDKWIGEARSVGRESDGAFAVMVRVHKRTTGLFGGISGLDKRSLASKYLHFHVPELFYIFDSRAEEAIRNLRLGRVRGDSILGDRAYGTFAAKCIRLKHRCEAEFGITLLPRQLDNLLLALGAESYE